MANEQKRLSDLPTVNSIALTDSLLALSNSAGNPYTATIAFGNLANSIPFANSSHSGVIMGTSPNLTVNSTGYVNLTFNGPFAGDGVANSNGIPVGGVYYDTSGIVRIRLS